MTLDYYKILQINPDANIETIKRAYRMRALECHPDRGGSHEQMVLVNEAWKILSNPVIRANYDAARLNVDNKEYVHKAEAESRNAREQAEQYPRDWNEFETWMDKTINAVISDFKKAGYGETSNWGMGIWPTAGKSFTGWIFIIVGGVLGLLLLYVLISATVGENYHPHSFLSRFLFLLFGGGGAFCGRFYHETMKKTLAHKKTPSCIQSLLKNPNTINQQIGKL